MNSLQTLTRNVSLLSCLMLLLGCGATETDRGPTGSLNGNVTYKGEAVKEGVVQFSHATEGFGGTATINEDGTYEVETTTGGLPIGQYQVCLTPPTIEKSLGPDTPPSEVPKEMPNIPQKYRAAKTSGLTVEIKEGENTFDIDMK